MSASVIDSLIITLGLDTTKFKQGRKETREDMRLAKEEARQHAKEIDEAGKTAAKFFTRMRNEALALFAVFTVGRGIKEFIRDITVGDAATGRLATNLGMSTEALAAWQGAAERAGGSASATGSSLMGLSQDFQNFSMTGQSAVIPYFRALNVQMSDAKGNMRPLGDILMDLADKFHGMSAQQSLFFGQRLGLDAGTIQLLRQGRGEVAKLLEDQKRLGLPSKTDTGNAVGLLNQLSDIRQGIESLARTALNDLNPVLSKTLGLIDDWLKKNREKAASGIADAIKRFLDYVSTIDWTEVGGRIDKFAVSVNLAVRAVGGLTQATEILFALWAGGKFLAMLANIRIMATALGGGALGALLRMLPALAPLLLMGPAGGEDKEFSDRKNKEFLDGRDSGFNGWMKENLPTWLGGSEKMDPVQKGTADSAMDFFTKQGWTPEQASGIVGNLFRESKFSPIAQNGSHYGVAQWDLERQKDIKSHFGKELFEMGFAEQLAAVQWELTQGKFKSVGDELHTKSNSSDSSALIHRRYEMPGNDSTEIPIRGADSTAILRNYRRFNASPTGYSPSSTTVNLNGPITVHTQAKDANGVAKGLGSAIQRYALAAQVNSGLA